MDVIINDAEVIAAAQELGIACEEISSLGARYRACLKRFAENGVSKGDVHQKLLDHVGDTEQPLSDLEDIVTSLKKETEKYIDEIAELDSDAL